MEDNCICTTNTSLFELPVKKNDLAHIFKLEAEITSVNIDII